MAPVVRITDQTWERLQKHAKPLVDTPDSVISTALDALDRVNGEAPSKNQNLIEKITEQSRQKKGDLTPQKDFRLPLLKALDSLGGRAPTVAIRNHLQKSLKQKFKAGDLEIVSSGEIRWWNAVCWERADLIRENLFREDSPRGIWELTSRGKAEAKKPTVV